MPSVKPGYVRRSRRGYIVPLAMLVFMVVGIILGNALRSDISSIATQTAWDNRRQLSAEAAVIGEAVKESVLSKAELQPTPDAGDMNAYLTNILNGINSSSNGITHSVSSNFSGYDAPGCWPNAIPANHALVPAGTLTNSLFGGWQLALCQAGPYYTSNPLVTPTVQLTRTVDGVNNRTFTATTSSIFVPVTNFTIGYSIPSQGIIAATSPTTAASWPGRTGYSVNSHSGIGPTNIMTQTAQVPATDSAVKAWSLNPAQPSARLSYANRELVSLCWTAWDYIWSPPYQVGIVNASIANNTLFDVATYASGTPGPGFIGSGGATDAIYNPATKTMDLNVGSMTSRTVTLTDSTASATFKLHRGGNSTAPMFLQIVGTRSGASQTVVEIAETLDKPIILIVSNCTIKCDYVTMKGALWCDPNCVGFYDGMTSETNPNLTIRGSFAFCAGSTPTNLVPVVIADQTQMAAIAPIAPQQTIVGVAVTTD